MLLVAARAVVTARAILFAVVGGRGQQVNHGARKLVINAAQTCRKISGPAFPYNPLPRDAARTVRPVTVGITWWSGVI